MFKCAKVFSRLIPAALSFLLLAFPILSSAEAENAHHPVYVGFDGEYGLKNSTSAQAIELGLKAAIHEINARGGVLGGRPIELTVKDNRSVPSRGISNMEEFAQQADLVAVFAGRFSPVILQQLDIVHAQKIPLLDVWGSADGVTDHAFKPSYTFRLSLKDAWAMPAMLTQAVAKGGDKIGVLLPNTGWGRSNQAALESALAKRPGVKLVGSVWYNWGEQDMLQHYQALLDAGAQAVLLVANDLEGSLLVRQLGERANVPRVPIVSHWGVTGGDMFAASGPALAELDFTIVQTFSFFAAPPGPLATFKASVKEVAGIEDMEKIESSVGVAHAYDMMHLLAKAIDAAQSTDRAAIRDALEKLGAHEGLVRAYKTPFTPENHDALGPEQVFFAKFRGDGVVVPVGK